ncbi:MAG: 30S ribosomal protein S2 [Dehalococcoidia bacterium]|nr:30S ribosomal protein S2 [Dehalococcoidia bacterium]
MRQLLEAGVHFGHQTRRWNPKMRRHIFTQRNGIHIIDLQQTVQYLEKAQAFVRDLVSQGGTVLFVGTKKQAQDAIAEEAVRCGMYYVNHRWLGGALTNFATIQGRIDYLVRLEDRKARGEFAAMTKKEAKKLEDELERMNRTLGGIKEMTRMPSALFVVDPTKERNAILEARKMGLPLVAMLDTNCDPDEIDVPIPANDDAIRAVRLMCNKIAEAVLDGVGLRKAQDEEQAAQESAELARATTTPAEAGAAPVSPQTFSFSPSEDEQQKEQP